MNDSIALLDTNVLVYAHDNLSPHHKSARNILKKAWKGDIRTCIGLQNIAEFFAVITDKKRSSKPLPFFGACKIINDYLQADPIEKVRHHRQSRWLDE